MSKQRRKPEVPWNTPMTDEDYIARFKRRCIITENGCWEWQGFCYAFRGMKPGQRGYATASVRNKGWRLHRWMVEVTQRKLLSGEVARHKCDNPPCINPDHLIPGTQKDNIADVIAKGKQQFHPSHYKTCKHGHDYSVHAWVDKYGHRHCKMCSRIRQRISSGWPRELAETAPAVSPGKRVYSAQNRGTSP